MTPNTCDTWTGMFLTKRHKDIELRTDRAVHPKRRHILSRPAVRLDNQETITGDSYENAQFIGLLC